MAKETQLQVEAIKKRYCYRPHPGTDWYQGA